MRLTAALFLAVLLAACGDGGASMIGTWQATVPEGEVRLELREEGQLVLTTPEGKTVQGSWQADAERLVMTVQAPGAEPVTLSCLYELSQQTLAIRPGDSGCGEVTLARKTG